MKHFKYTIIFLISLFLIDRVLYHLISDLELDFGANKYYFKMLKPYLKGEKIDILILGSSRTYEAVHPVHIKDSLGINAFKEAQHGKNGKYNYYFYKEYKKIVGIPKLVIYGIDHFIHHPEAASNKEVLAKLPQHYDSSFNHFEKSSSEIFFDLNLSLFSNRGEIAQFINNFINFSGNYLFPVMKKAFYRNMKFLLKYSQIYLGTPTDKRRLITLKPNRFDRSCYKSYPGPEGQYFMQLLYDLEKDGVKVMLIIIPDHIGTYLTNTQKRSHVNEVRDFARKYKNVFAYNYNKPDLFPINKHEFFLDGGYGCSASHLSAKGAEFFFYNLLLKDIKELYRRGI